MTYHAIEKRLAALERIYGDEHLAPVEVIEAYTWPDGTRREERSITTSEALAAAEQAFDAKLAARALALAGKPIDERRLPIIDLLAMGRYAEIVRRVDTWFTWTSAPLSDSLVNLAELLRPCMEEGETL